LFVRNITMPRTVEKKVEFKPKKEHIPSGAVLPFEWKDEWKAPKPYESIADEWEWLVDSLYARWEDTKSSHEEGAELTDEIIIEALIPTLFEEPLDTWDDVCDKAVSLLDL